MLHIRIKFCLAILCKNVICKGGKINEKDIQVECWSSNKNNNNYNDTIMVGLAFTKFPKNLIGSIEYSITSHGNDICSLGYYQQLPIVLTVPTELFNQSKMTLGVKGLSNTYN